jgi:hypothetical protein
MYHRANFSGFVKLFGAILLVCTVSAGTADAITVNPFSAVIGKWSGSGLMTMRDGTRERIACDAEHTGNSLQLRLVIHCPAGERDIRLVARLSSNNGRLLGFWEEKYFNAAGAISGVASENEIKFNVSGNVNGTMLVTYTKNTQQVVITTQQVPLASLKIDMTRR